ncbi:MAG: glycoside hydrolase family 43 protein [Pirellulales bacterium]|nr:glycoside hydrolase family 43 protein [Pirellulales bacterium]
MPNGFGAAKTLKAGHPPARMEPDTYGNTSSQTEIQPMSQTCNKMPLYIPASLAAFLILSSSVLNTNAAEKPIAIEQCKGDVFLLPYFLGNGETGVYIAYSRDGLNFKWLNHGKVVLPAPPWGDTSLTRDPSIIYHDGVFHMVWTTNWNSRTIGYAHSKDLLNWSKPRKIDVWGDFTAVKNTWAPELHWDPEKKEFLIIWSSTTLEELNDNDGSENRPEYDHRTYATRTRDFKTFSKAALFFSPQDPEHSVIDPYIAHDDRGTPDASDDRWVMVIKNELKPERGGKNLRLTFSKRMQGPYGTKLGPAIVGAGTDIVDTMGEGPSLLKYKNLWYLYWDAPNSKYSYCLATSPDLVHWKNRSPEMTLPTEHMRHGTVLIVPATVVAEARQ